MAFMDHPIILLGIALLSLPVYAILAKMFWGEHFDSLPETLEYLIRPDLYSFFKGRYWDDWRHTMKCKIYIGLCFGWAAAITELLARHVL